MPRPSRPLDPDAGPAQALAAELRKLREEAGSPKYLQMARRTGKSRTALAEAAGGDHLPTWETVAAFVTACDGDPNAWRERWEWTRDHLRAPAGQAGSAPPEAPEPEVREPAGEDGAGRPAGSRVGHAVPYAATAVAGAAIAAAMTVVVDGTVTRQTSAAVERPPGAVVVTVQNKVALGRNRLIEDTTPAYLSARPVPSCARNGCKVAGTDVGSGAMLVAVCRTRGTEMFNYNLDSSESRENPHRADSAFWHKAVFPDGRSGFLSEVYVAPADRGGKGLARCAA
ncbi:helix-turn-helix transcriptional regulator [Actinomadura sp. DC4]|uniref:helix-turn-helix domain-containing protein n=1 Tax=Actinomadura sp. DC4 TaxID=3055069 RepID=UPI0025B00F1F|nr:helix-turn-helix transcriptional regulator [Actinomadura sp. DC4]MDN3356338.1 helix-turn-helix transcriptional regulator [Actinomadura sp. DC4]